MLRGSYRVPKIHVNLLKFDIIMQARSSLLSVPFFLSFHSICNTADKKLHSDYLKCTVRSFQDPNAVFLVEVPYCGNIVPLGFQPLLSIILEAVFLPSNTDLLQMTEGNEQNHFKSSHALEKRTDPRIMRQNGGKNPQGNYPHREANISAGDSAE